MQWSIWENIECLCDEEMPEEVSNVIHIIQSFSAEKIIIIEI